MLIKRTNGIVRNAIFPLYVPETDTKITFMKIKTIIIFDFIFSPWYYCRNSEYKNSSRLRYSNLSIYDEVEVGYNPQFYHYFRLLYLYIVKADY